MTVEERLDELEKKYCYLDETVSTLNEVVISKNSEIEKLNLKIASLEQSLDSYIDSSSEQKPPHY